MRTDSGLTRNLQFAILNWQFAIAALRPQPFALHQCHPRNLWSPPLLLLWLRAPGVGTRPPGATGYARASPRRLPPPPDVRLARNRPRSGAMHSTFHHQQSTLPNRCAPGATLRTIARNASNRCAPQTTTSCGPHPTRPQDTPGPRSMCGARNASARFETPRPPRWGNIRCRQTFKAPARATAAKDNRGSDPPSSIFYPRSSILSFVPRRATPPARRTRNPRARSSKLLAMPPALFRMSS